MSDKYAFQVGIRNVEFDFDEAAAAQVELRPDISEIDKMELYLRLGHLAPVEFTELDGTVHWVVEWDPRPVGYSGFMDCCIHSRVTTDQGVFEVGRYAAVSLSEPSKVWQWFIHRRLTDDAPQE